MKYSHFKLKLRAVVGVIVMFVLGLSANAQQISVSGVVKDAANGEPILGASILQKGTNKGIITNVDGAFTISVPSNATLVVKYLGYLTVEVPVVGKKTIVIQLKENSVALGEVVAIGYGVVKKNDATGSITAIKPDKMNKGLTSNAQDMIVGKIAGVSVITGGGTPGGSATIRIRGGSSLNASNDPLFVIDGLAMDNDGIQGVANPLSTINPNDIESFTVLKDASATAIYGSRASNGVIIITTKKGDKNGKLKISYDGNTSISKVNNSIKVLNGDQFRDIINTLYPGTDAKLAKSDSVTRSYLGKENTNWYDQIFQTAISHDHNLTAMGSWKKTPYRVSVGYTNTDGIVKTSNFERFIGSVNLSPSFLDDHLKVNLMAKGMLVRNRYADGGVVGAAMTMDPTQPVRSTDPKFNIYGGYFQWRAVNGTNFGINNPVATLNQKSDVSKAKDLILNADFDYKFHFLPDLRAHLNLGMETSEGTQTLYIDSLALSDSPYGRQGFQTKSKYNKSLSAYLQYAKEIGKHKFDVMGGYEWQHFYNQGNNEYQGLVKNVVSKTGDLVGYNYKNDLWKTENYLVSFFGRLNYSFDSKYLFTFTLRDDGSSRFRPENRWGLFPATAVAWKVNEEDFMKDNKVVSDLKVRLGYGVTGQQNIGYDYAYFPIYTTNIVGAFQPFDSTYYSTSRPDAYNKNLKWEVTTTYNAGLDFGFLNNRILGSIDLYRRTSNDLLNEVAVPALTNFKNRVISNIGVLENTGLEFTINAKAISTRDLTWEIGFNTAFNKNTVKQLISGQGADYWVETGGPFQGTTQVYHAGQPTYSFYVYKQKYDANGHVIETGALKDPANPSAGKYELSDAFENLIGDSVCGKPLINEKDKYYNHSINPDVTLGLSSKLIYKNFDFGFSLHASIGNYLYNSVQTGNYYVGRDGVAAIYSTGSICFINKPVSSLNNGFQGSDPNIYLSDYFVQNASFLRLDNVTVGYSFKNLFKVISSGRIYATVQNPFILTNYKGLDPEQYGDHVGIDNNIYPRPMITVFGLSLNF